MNRGMLDVDGLRAAVADGSIDTVILAFPDLYGRLLGKRLDASFFLTDVVGGTHACDYLFTVDMEMEPISGYAFSNWELGYGDMHLAPDLGTIRKLSWLDRTALVICDAELEPGHEPVEVAPRSILRKQMGRLRAIGIRGDGRIGVGVLPVSGLRSWKRRASGYRNLRETGWYIGGLQPSAGFADRGPERSISQTSCRIGRFRWSPPRGSSGAVSTS